MENYNLAEELEKHHKPTIAEGNQFDSSEVLRALHGNEDGDARLFNEIHKDNFIYDHAAGQWYEWAGHYWRLDEKNEVTEAVQDVIKDYAQEAQRQSWKRLKAIKSSDKEAAAKHQKNEDALFKRIKELQRVRRKKDILYLATVGRGLSGHEWDNGPMLLGCKNGIIDLATGKHRPGKPSDHIKTVAPTEWQGIDAPCDNWTRFLSEIFAGDAELIKYVQRLLGYGITGKTSDHVHPIFWGKGRNGKTTMFEALRHVLGLLAYKADSEILLKQRFARQAGAPDASLMALQGKRLVYASESDEGRNLNASKLKELCGGDTLTGRAPYGRRQVEFTPSHLLLLLTNHKPHAPARDYALWARIHLIPFNMSFIENPSAENERKADPDLLEKLKGQASGILAWLVRGCLDWQKQGLNPPDTVTAATKEYQRDEDIMGHFIDVCCIIGDRKEIKAGQLYSAYKDWANEAGHRPVSLTKFGRDIRERHDSYKNRSGVHYIGIGLLAESVNT